MNFAADHDTHLNTGVMPLEEIRLLKKLRVENPLGLHARPAAYIVRLLRDMQSDVTFTFRRQTIDARSVLGLLMLGAPRNGWITVCVKGSDAVLTMQMLEDAFKQKFGEQM